MSNLIQRYACSQPGCSEFNIMKEVSTELTEGNLYFPIQPLCGGCLVPVFRNSVDRAANAPEVTNEVAAVEAPAQLEAASMEPVAEEAAPAVEVQPEA